MKNLCYISNNEGNQTKHKWKTSFLIVLKTGRYFLCPISTENLDDISDYKTTEF